MTLWLEVCLHAFPIIHSVDSVCTSVLESMMLYMTTLTDLKHASDGTNQQSKRNSLIHSVGNGVMTSGSGYVF